MRGAQRQRQSPRSGPPPWLLKPVLPHTVAFTLGAGAAGPDGKEALSWWAGQPSATLLSPQPFLMPT